VSRSPDRILPLVVASALFMETMDTTILATALPTIARDLNLDPIALKLAVTSYLIGFAIVVPVSGWLADRYGAKTVFRIAIAIFISASIGCAFSGTLSSFVGWRLIEGAGAALMTPVGRLVLVRSIAKDKLVSAMATLTIPSLLGPILGPPLGGLIVTYADWRWIFLVNVPIGLIGMTLATLYFNNERAPERTLDLKGCVLSAIALTGLIAGAASMGRHVAPLWLSGVTFAIGGLAAWAYVRHARVTATPVLDLRLFNLTTFDAGVAGGALFRVGVGASAFLVPLMLQIGFGLDPLTAGLIMLWGAAGALTMKFFAGRILARVGFRRVLIWNGLAASAITAVFALVGPTTPHAVIAGLLLATGVIRSLQFTSLNAISYADIGPDIAPAATSLTSVSQQVSLSFGVALGALVLEASEWSAGRGTPAPADFATALVAVALISSFSVWRLSRLDTDAGHVLAGRAPQNPPDPSSDI
jgi:EmrB/QacA subfamily drug resistance transporter